MDVIGSGRASVIQKTAINNIKYAHFMASTVWGSSPLSKIIGESRKGPRITTHVLQNTLANSFIGNSRKYNEYKLSLSRQCEMFNIYQLSAAPVELL